MVWFYFSVDTAYYMKVARPQHYHLEVGMIIYYKTFLTFATLNGIADFKFIDIQIFPIIIQLIKYIGNNIMLVTVFSLTTYLN